LQILENINVKVEKEEVLRLLGHSKSVPLLSEIERILRIEIREGYRLVEPKAMYTKLGVKEIDSSSIILDNDFILHVNGTTRPWRNSEHVIIALCTIGSALERRVAELFNEGNLVSAVVLDSVGSVAVESVDDLVYHFIYQREEELGFSVSSRLEPGCGEWSLGDQEVIKKILQPAKIGIKLNEYCMMIPEKSISFCVATGKELDSEMIASPCQICGMNNCKYRSVE